jgi:hypothetical protein
MQIKFQTANSPPAFNKSNTFRGYFTGMLHVFTIGYWHSMRRVPLEEQELPTLPEHLSSPPVVSRSLVLCVCFVDHCLLFCFFSFCHCLVCPSSIYGFWLPLWWILIDMLKLPWCTQLLTSFFYKIKKDLNYTKYSPGQCVVCDLWILITTLVSSNFSSMMYTAFDFNIKKIY